MDADFQCRLEEEKEIEVSARNAQLAAEADQSNDEWKRKEETYSSQVNNVKLSAQ
jgi:hypothetical protein